MSENKLTLQKRELTGKKVAKLRAQGLIPSVVYGGQAEPITTQSAYNETEKVLLSAGYHSTVDLEVDGKPQLAIVKDVALDPASRRIINVEFQAVSADKPVEATTPIVLEGFESSDAAKLHFALLQVMEEVEVKAKPAELPKSLTIDASKLATLDDKLTIADISLPQGVELADKELKPEQIIASLYDPAAEAAAREAEAAKENEVDAADVPADNGTKPEEPAAEATEKPAE